MASRYSAVPFAAGSSDAASCNAPELGLSLWPTEPSCDSEDFLPTAEGNDFFWTVYSRLLMPKACDRKRECVVQFELSPRTS